MNNSMNTSSRRSAWQRTLINLAGWGFVVLGILGLFLPVLQGILFLMIGFAILSTEYVWAHHLFRRLRSKFPKLDQQFEKMKARLSRFWPE